MLLGEILLKKGLISETKLNFALDEQKETKEFLGAVLVKRGFVTELDLAKALSEQFQLPYIDLKGEYIDWNVTMRFTPSLIVDQSCFPYRQSDKGVYVAITNPLDAGAMGRAEAEANGEIVKFSITTMSAMKEAVQNYHRQAATRIKKLLD